MWRWRRSRPAWPWLLAGAGAVGVAAVTLVVAGGDDEPDQAEAVQTTTTSAISLMSTIASIPLPDQCLTDPDSLAAWTAAVLSDAARGTADAVLRFENLTDATCELDLTDSTARVDGVERSVRLEPGGWGELLVGSADSECGEHVPVRSVVIELNDVERIVPTAAVVACDQALLAFLPADPPTEPCRSADLSAAVAPSGLVVRNDGSQPCVLGELESIDLPMGPAPSLAEMVQTRPGTAIDGPVGPGLTGLGPGDVAFYQTFVDPLADCILSGHPARLNFAAVVVPAEFPICTFVRLGPGRPFYGSPRGPLGDAGLRGGSAGDAERWLAELDPFRST